MFIRTVHSLKFLIKGPIILVFLFFVNLLASPGDWWWPWAALGIGIAWVFALMRVIWAIMVAGGLAALAVYFMNRRQAQAGQTPTPGAQTRPPDITIVPVAKP